MADAASAPSTGSTQAPGSTLLTVLIADVRGYTKYTQEHGDEAAAALADRFAALIDGVVSDLGGSVVELRGDEALCVFSSARQALRAAVTIQARCVDQMTLNPALHLKVGIGLDAGEVVPIRGGFRGGALNLAARLCALATAGEVLSSSTVVGLAGRMADLTFAERGPTPLKGFSHPVQVVQVRQGEEAHPAASPPANTVARTSPPIGGFLGALPASSLVARDDELQRIEVSLDEASAGRGNLLLLTGEPGVGKTRLAQEITVRARVRHFVVATGRCYEPYAAAPFYPLREAMTHAWDAAPPAVQNMAPDRWPHLSRLLADRRLPLSPETLSSHEEQQRLFWSVTGFVQALSAQTPVVLLLDDLHWADNSTIELLAHLVRHLRGNAVLFVGMYRDSDVAHDHPLARAALDLNRERLAQRMIVNRLSPAGTAALMEETVGHGDLPPEVISFVHRHTDGNPFFCEELIRSLLERGDVLQHGGAWSPRALMEVDVPQSVRAVIWHRVSRLSPDAQNLLMQASVLGQGFQFDDVLALSGPGLGSKRDAEDMLEAALVEATNAGIVRPTRADSYVFNHVLTQQALYTELSPRRRKRIHLAAGEGLEGLPEVQRSGRIAELAWHFVQGGDPGRGLRYSLLAGDSAEAVFAHDEAGTHFRCALELAQEVGDSALEAQVRERLGSLLTATIKYGAALRMSEEAAGLYAEVGDAISESRVVAQLGRIHGVHGTVEAGIERLEACLQSMGPHLPAASRAGLQSALAGLYFAAGRFEDALQLAAQAAEGASRGSGVAAEAEVRRGAALVMLGRDHEGELVLMEARDRARAVGDQFSLCRASQYLAGIEMLRRDGGGAMALLDTALQLAERMGNPRQIAVSCFGFSLAALMAGDAALSSSHAERALSMMHAHEGSWATACQIGGFNRSLFTDEEWARAPRYLVECIALIQRPPQPSQDKQGEVRP